MRHRRSTQSMAPMRRKSARCSHRRQGAVLVWFALLLTLLLGLLGLVLDTGLLFVSHRRAQNAADAAALAAAMDKFRGSSNEVARLTANEHIKVLNGLTGAPDLVTDATFNIPPNSGPYEDNADFVEVIVTVPVQTILIQILGGNANRQVRARAVAGFESVASGEGAIVLDPTAVPGLSVQGTNAGLTVYGTVVINSMAEGLDQDGTWVNTHPTDKKYAVQTQPQPSVLAEYVQIAGGVDVPTNIRNVHNPADLTPVYFSRAPMAPDPLAGLPIPSGSNGVDLTNRGSVSINSGTVTLSPGIYESITIQNNANVTFEPGIYIFQPRSPNQGLFISGSPTVDGTRGVMFYMTGGNYIEYNNDGTVKTAAGYHDSNDGALDYDPANNYQMPPRPSTEPTEPIYATVDINANQALVNLQPLDDESSPFHGMLFYQRRRNTNAFQIQGRAGANLTLAGTVYTKWANLKLAGAGRYDAQFVVGSLTISGQAVVTILGTGKNFGTANQVFLVE